MHSENRQLQDRLKNVISLDKMKQALEQKDLDLAAVQKTTREKTELADKKLALVEKLEEENATLRTTVDEAKKEAVQMKEEKATLADRVEALTQKRDELETYLGGITKKMFRMLEGIFLYSNGCKEPFFIMLPSSQHFLCMQNSVRTSRKKPGESRQTWTLSIFLSRMKLP